MGDQVAVLIHADQEGRLGGQGVEVDGRGRQARLGGGIGIECRQSDLAAGKDPGDARIGEGAVVLIRPQIDHLAANLESEGAGAALQHVVEMKVFAVAASDVHHGGREDQLLAGLEHRGGEGVADCGEFIERDLAVVGPDGQAAGNVAAEVRGEIGQVGLGDGSVLAVDEGQGRSAQALETGRCSAGGREVDARCAFSGVAPDAVAGHQANFVGSERHVGSEAEVAESLHPSADDQAAGGSVGEGDLLIQGLGIGEGAQAADVQALDRERSGDACEIDGAPGVEAEPGARQACSPVVAQGDSAVRAVRTQGVVDARDAADETRGIGDRGVVDGRILAQGEGFHCPAAAVLEENLAEGIRADPRRSICVAIARPEGEVGRRQGDGIGGAKGQVSLAVATGAEHDGFAGREAALDQQARVFLCGRGASRDIQLQSRVR